jgi:hypothetical protein
MDIFGEMTNMLQAYFECDKNTQAAIRLYHQRFPNRTVPHYKKFYLFLFYTRCPQKRRRVHNSIIYRKILITCTLN